MQKTTQVVNKTPYGHVYWEEEKLFDEKAEMKNLVTLSPWPRLTHPERF
jgi:hypothetical protein